MKTKFELESVQHTATGIQILPSGVSINIIGKAPESRPYLSLTVKDTHYFIPDKDLKLFAKNILAALGATKLTIIYGNNNAKSAGHFGRTKNKAKKRVSSKIPARTGSRKR